ncbi:hypothetical protein AB0J83_42085 [Actinoplanes sp. NPDC049596]|uniref:hypothetical protein n=1 Tax=unclassified Actinoplanes TaxID=2626549 RepID=UPI0034138178
MTARLQVWGWWSKDAGNVDEYRVLESNDPDAAAVGVQRRNPGTPQTNAQSGQLPWAVIGTTGDTYHVSWWDWTDTSDARTRPIYAVLYLQVSSPSPLSYAELAAYARAQWRRHAQDRAGIPSGPSPQRHSAAEQLQDEATRRWAGAVAGLVLQNQVRISATDASGPATPEEVCALLDAVAALLPAATRATLSLATGTVQAKNGPFNITVGKPVGRSAQVSFSRPPELADGSPAAEYRDTLERMVHRFRLTDVLDHLDRVAEMPAEPGAQTAREATARLAAMDQLTEIGTALLHGRHPQPELVRSLVAAHPLAGRTSEPMQLAYLRYLIRDCGAPGLELAAANWLPDAAGDAVDVLAAALAQGEPDPAWLAAMVRGPAAVAGADTLLVPVLNRVGVTAPVTTVLAGVVTDGLPATATRDWLLQPEHEPGALRLVHRAPDAAVAWFSTAGRALPWISLIRSALDGKRHPLPGLVDQRWLMLAFKLATARFALGQALNVLLPELVHAAESEGLNKPFTAAVESAAADNGTDRATCDFVLTVSGQSLPPGLRSESSWAGDAGYAEQLAALLSGSSAGVRATFRKHLRLMLISAEATEDAVVLLDRISRTGGIDARAALDDAAHIAAERPLLLERPGAEELREQLLAADPHLHSTVLLRAAERMSRTSAAPADFAGVLAQANRLNTDPRPLRIAVNRWSATASTQQLRELAEAAGHRDRDTDDWVATYQGLQIIHPLLGEDLRPRLNAALREDVATDAEALDAEITRLIRRRQALAGIEELLGLPTGPSSPPKGLWAALLRFFGFGTAPEYRDRSRERG